MRSSLVVPSPRRALSPSCGARPLFPIPEKAPPTAAPAKAPNDITTRRAPQEALAASKKPSIVPTTTNPMKMSFLISTSWIEPTSDGAGFKPIATYPDNISTIKARGPVKVLGYPIFVIDFCLCNAIFVRHADCHALIRLNSAKNSVVLWFGGPNFGFRPGAAIQIEPEQHSTIGLRRILNESRHTRWS